MKDQYEWLEKLGEGSFGSVHLVRSYNDGNLYAIKKIRINYDALIRIKNEISIMRDLSNPVLIKYYAHFVDDKYVYIVMEYAEGNSLRKVLLDNTISKTTIEPEKVIKFLQTMLLGLDILATKSIIHRDIKPENILISHNDFKISDYGISKYYDYSMNHTVIGTNLYMAPEVRTQHYDFKADIYSLGKVLEEICSILKDKTHFQALINSMTEINPEKRPTTCQIREMIRRIPTKQKTSRLLNLSGDDN